MIYKKCDAHDLENNNHVFSELFINVYKTSFPDTMSDNAFGQERVYNLLGYVIDGSAIVYGAFEDDRLTGFIWGYKRQVNEEIRIHVPVLIVSEQHQRKGIARRLMEMMETYASDCGIGIIEVMVTSSNEGALSKHTKVCIRTLLENPCSYCPLFRICRSTVRSRLSVGKRSERSDY